MKNGFTLIEMLVVVLIIAIIGAIALPQYQKARRKAEVAEVAATLKAFYQAAHEYRLTNGVWSDKLSDLTINLPPGAQKIPCKYNPATQECWLLGKYHYIMGKQDSIQAHPIAGKASAVTNGADYSNYAYSISLVPQYDGQFFCVVVPSILSAANKNSAPKWCEDLTGIKNPPVFNSAKVYRIPG